MPTSAPKHRPRRAAPPAEAPQQVRRHGTPRESASARGYGSRWRKSSQAYLQRHRLCVHCLEKGRTTLALAVDHIVPHRGDMTLFWDPTNWQALCKTCHNRKTAAEDGGFGNTRKEHASTP